MTRLWAWVVGVVCWAYHYARVKQAWTHLYRWVHERQWRDVKLAKYRTLAEVAARLRPDWWRADGPLQLWDASSSPEYVEAVWSGLAPQPTRGFDCDEFATYCCAAVRANGLGVAHVLTVVWVGPEGTAGHNVCLLTAPSEAAWLDYGQPHGGAKSVAKVAGDVARQYGKGPCVFWCVQELDGAPVRCGFSGGAS